MAINWAHTVHCYEVHGSRKENFISSGGGPPTATVRLAVLESEVFVAIREILGYVMFYPYPTFPSIMTAISISRAVDGGKFTVDNDELLSYDWAFIDVSYTSRTGVYQEYYVQGQPTVFYYIEDKIEPRTEYLPVSNRSVIWSDGKKVLGQEIPSLPINGHTLIHIVSGYKFFPVDTIALIGKTNSSPYVSANLGRVYQQGELMLRSLQINTEWTHNSYRPDLGVSVPTYTVVAKYEYKSTADGKWLKFRKLDPLNGPNYWKFDNLLVPTGPGTGNIFTPFPEADHRSILFN